MPRSTPKGRRARKRLTLPKKSIKAKRSGPQLLDDLFGSPLDVGPNHLRKPTAKEWETMTLGDSFIIQDKIWKKGDDVVLNSSEENENPWVAKIISIRKRDPDDSWDVWVLVQWYYSAQDLHDVSLQNIGSRNIEGMSKSERVMSDKRDILHIECFKGTTYVHEYCENDPDGTDIPPDAFFQRFTINLRTGVLTPFTTVRTCIKTCQILYHPYVPHSDVAEAALRAFYHYHKPNQIPSQLELALDVMHFCPRPNCGRWFHEACLSSISHFAKEGDMEFTGIRPLRLLAGDPDSDDAHPLFTKFLYPKPARGKMASSFYEEDKTVSLISAVQSLKRKEFHLPDAVIRIAAEPIIRRANCGQFSLTGNMKDVVLARRLVYQELDGGHECLTKLISHLGPKWQERDTDYSHVWHVLNSQRILASPYVLFWENLVHSRGGTPDAWQSQVGLYCPECSNDLLVAI